MTPIKIAIQNFIKKYFIRLFSMLSIALVVNCSYAKKNINSLFKTKSSTSFSSPSFRLKTEVGNWITLKPNIGFEYKFNELFSVNVNFTYDIVGYPWVRLV